MKGCANHNNRASNGKIIIVLVLINCPVHAGVSGLITALKGECNPPDQTGVRLCSDRKSGRIYYIKDDVRYEVYPVPQKKKGIT